MVKVPLSNSFLERRNGRQKFTESFGAGTSLAPRLCQWISLGSVNHWKVRYTTCQSWTDEQLRLDSRSIVTFGQDRARTGRSGHTTNLRSHFVIRPCCAPDSDFVLDSSGLSLSQTKENWRERLLPCPSTPQTLYVKFIFLRTSPLTVGARYSKTTMVYIPGPSSPATSVHVDFKHIHTHTHACTRTLTHTPTQVATESTAVLQQVQLSALQQAPMSHSIDLLSVRCILR